MAYTRDSGGIASTIKDPRVIAARKGLEQGRLFLIEGAAMLRQALDSRAPLASVFFLDPPDAEAQSLEEPAAKVAETCCRTARGVFFKVLGLGYETSTEVLALVRIPEHDAEPLLRAEPPADGSFYLVGQGIQDPRNVGVLVRTADAFSAAAFVLSADSASPWSRQSIRSTTGSILRVPVLIASDLEGFVDRLRVRGVCIVGTSASAELDCRAAPYRFPCAVILGNETHGISPRVRAASDLLVRIPMSGGAHSLNVTVAAGIMLHEVARSRPPA